MGNDLLQKKFDDIDGKIESMIAYCRSLQVENSDLRAEVGRLEAELEKTETSTRRFSENEAMIQSKIDGLLRKLEEFSKS